MTSETLSAEVEDMEWRDPLRPIKAEVIKALKPIQRSPETRRLYAGSVRGALSTQLICVAGLMAASKEQLPRWRVFQRRRANTAIRAAEKALSQIVTATDVEVANFIVYGIGIDAVNVGKLTADQLVTGLNEVVTFDVSSIPEMEPGAEMPSGTDSAPEQAQLNPEPNQTSLQ